MKTKIKKQRLKHQRLKNFKVFLLNLRTFLILKLIPKFNFNLKDLNDLNEK